jgi:hypothetical protein
MRALRTERARNPRDPKGGCIQLPATSGLDVELNEDALKARRHRDFCTHVVDSLAFLCGRA